MRLRLFSRAWLLSTALFIGFTAVPSLAQYGNFKAPAGGAKSAGSRAAKPKPTNTGARKKPQTTTRAVKDVHKPDRGGHRSWQGYQPGYYSNRPPQYPGRNQPLPQPGVDYYPGPQPYNYGGYRNTYYYPGYYPGYYPNYQYNPGPNARQGRRQGSGR